MAKSVKGYLQLSLKVVNLLIGLVGIAMILYSIWMVRVWQRDSQGKSSDEHQDLTPPPWFIHAFLGMGITLCAITCLGHFAAGTANACCLSCYMVVIFLLLLLETALIADIVLNSDWEKDLPEDPTGRFDDFKDFVKSNFDTCKWIGLFIIFAQGLSILLATVLKTINMDHQSRIYESDESVDDRIRATPSFPFLRHYTLHPIPLPYALDSPFLSKNYT